jgi:hypothetical protein
MIFGQNILSLRCRKWTGPGNRGGCLSRSGPSDRFSGRDQTDARRNARRAGWTFRDGDAQCPRCNGRAG